MKTKLLAPLAGFVLLAGTLSAQVPQLLNYQGRVAVGTPAVNFTGSGLFRFALVDAAGTTSYWSNDGTSSAGSQPTAAVTLTVTKGLYSVLLGDTALPNMTAIPNSVFNHADVRLRVWFDDRTANGPQLLTPDQRLAAVGYAMMAGNVPDGVITGAKLAEGSIGTSQLADFAVTGGKLRLGYEAGTNADGALVAAAGNLTFTRSFAYPFSVAPAVSLLSPGWSLGPVNSTGFSATIAFLPLTLDSTGYVGQHCSLAVVNGLPAISYFDATNGNLNFVRANDPGGTVWDPPVTVDTGGTGIVGQYTSLAVIDGNPAISYYDLTNGNLNFVRATDAMGFFWGVPRVLDSTGNVGTHTTLALVNGNPAVCYWDVTHWDLKYVRAMNADGTIWDMPVTLASTGDVGRTPSLAVVNGTPAISYHDNTAGDLIYLRANDANGADWGGTVTVDSAGDAGVYTSLVVVNGHPAISYLDATNYDLKYVRATNPEGTAWATPLTLDSADTVGFQTSLAVVAGHPAIGYQDLTNGDLKYVRATDASGTAWATPVTLDSAGDVAEYLSLAEVDGKAAISYYDTTNGDLKFAVIPELDLSWQASDGTVAPLTAATAVMAANIAAGAVGSSQLAANAVTSANIAAGAVGFSSLAKPPQSGSLEALATLRFDFGQASFTIGFPQAFAAVPVVTCSLASNSDTFPAGATVRVTSTSATQFSGKVAASTSSPLTLDSAGAVGQYNSLAMVNNNPAISYFDETNGNLKYVRATDFYGTAWSLPVTPDNSAGTVGSYTSLKVVNGNPAISYYDETNSDLKYVRATDASGTAWGTPITLDSTGDVGLYTSLAVVGGRPAIAYLSTTHPDLKYVRATDASGTAWGTPVILDNTGHVSSYCSLAVVNGSPAISYYDTTTDDLKFIREEDPPACKINWIALPP
jgi:hypothetical protein